MKKGVDSTGEVMHI